jgi:heat-inducible transcriptional repressor
VLEQPEFRDDFERMKTLFSAFEEKSLLVKILDKSLDDSGLKIYLGSENAVEEFSGLSFVTALMAGTERFWALSGSSAR